MTDPFTLAMLLIVALSVAGLSVGLAMMCGSFLYLLLKGFDPSLAKPVARWLGSVLAHDLSAAGLPFRLADR